MGIDLSSITTDPEAPGYPNAGETFEKVYTATFANGHAELIISTSATLSLTGSIAAAGNLMLVAQAKPASVHLYSPGPKVDPQNPQAAGPRRPGNNEYTFSNDPANPGQARVQVPCVLRVSPKGMASAVRSKVNLETIGFAATWGQKTADGNMGEGVITR